MTIPEKPRNEEDPLLGTLLEGKYRVARILGAGGMSTVYAAVREQIGDTVAIKVLGDEAMGQPLAVKRFQREARAVARIKHPNVISVYDFGSLADGRAFMVMEYIEGGSVRDELKVAGRLTPQRVAQIMRPVCAAVQAAHEEGVIHRDLKPENIMISRHKDGSEVVKVVDFGVAELRESAASSALTKLTEMGLMVGTPHYMSPEQCRSEDLDSRTDIYSLGIILYELLTGTVPFNARTVSAVIIQHATEQPRRFRERFSDIDWALEHVVLRALEKDPSRRPQTAAELAHTLQLAIEAGRTTLTFPGPPSIEMPSSGTSTGDVSGMSRPLGTRRLTSPFRTPAALSESDQIRRRTASLHVDSLTGIYNQSFLILKLEEGLASGTALALLMVGIDDFKRVNNLHGYLTGDAVLREIAGWLRDHIGNLGTVSRTTSDEFAIVLTDRTPEDILAIAGEMLEKFAAHPFLTAEVPDGVNLGCTIGVVMSPRDGATPHDLFEAGGRALRHAKRYASGQVYRLGEEVDDHSVARLNFNTFVGRAREIRLLEEGLDRVIRGRGKPILVMAPTGLGKTRLAHEFRRKVAGKKITFLTGHFFESGQGAPYKAFYECLRAPIQAILAREEDGRIEDLFGSLTDRVCRDFGSDEGFLYFCEFVQVENAHEKFLTFEYLTNLFIILSQQQPLVLFFDDLHWADELSLEMLAYLTRASAGHRIFGFASARSEGITERHPLRNWLRTLNQNVGVDVVTLEPLSRDEVHTLLRAIFSRLRISGQNFGLLYKETKGNPYFLCEILRYLVQQGHISRAGDTWECGALDDIVLPQSVVDVVEASLNRIDARVIEMLMVASVIGPEFSFDLLQAVSQQPESELLRAVEEGLAQQLIREVVGLEDDVYEFHHGTVQKVLYSRLNRRRRRSVHAQVGQAIENQFSFSGQTGRVLAELAYHYYNAGDFLKTLRFAVGAGVQAWRAWSIDEALRFFSWAEEAVRRSHLLPEIADDETNIDRIASDHLDLLVELKLTHGQVLINVGQLEDAEKSLQIALALSRRMNNERLRGRTLSALGEMSEARSEYSLSLLYCRQAIEVLRRTGDTRAEARTLCTIGTVYDRLGQLGRAVESFQRSLAMARGEKDRCGEAVALRELGFTLLKCGQYRKGMESARAALEAFRQTNDTLGETISLNILGVGYLWQGRSDLAFDLFTESMRKADQLNRPRGEAIELANLAECHRLQGDLAKALDLNQQALTLVHRIGNRQLESLILLNLGRVFQARHEHDTAMDYFQQGLHIVSAISDRLMECDLILAIAEVHLAQSHPGEAMETVHPVLATAAELEALPLLWRASFVSGRCLYFLGQGKEAERSLQEAVQILDQLGTQLAPDVSMDQFLEDKKPVYRALESVRSALETAGKS